MQTGGAEAEADFPDVGKRSDSEMILERKSKTDLLEEQLCRHILRESLDTGAVLPSENMICRQFKVSRVTVRRAIANLADQNVVYSERGKGLFVKSLENTRRIYGADVLTRNIALFFHRNEYTLPAIFGIEDVVKNAGFRLTFCSLGKEYEQNARNILSHAKQGIDACVVTPMEMTPYPPVYIEMFRKLKNPIVFDADPPDDSIPSVRTDDFAGIRQVMDYLFSLGHRRIAFVGGEPLTSSNTDRRNAYRSALAECADAEPEIILEVREYLRNHLTEVLEEYLAHTAKRDLPTAIVCSNDSLAETVFRILSNHGLRIPEDISLTGYANLKCAYQTTPSITTVEQHPYEQGHRLGELLLKLIFKQEIPERHIKITPTLQINPSCSPPRKEI